MRKYKHRPEDETSLPEESGSWWKFFSLFSVFFLPLSLPNFSGSVLWSRGSGPGHWQKGTMMTQWQQKIKSLSLYFRFSWKHAAVKCFIIHITCVLSQFSFLFYFYNERRLFIETTEQYVWFGLVCLVVFVV